MKITGISTLPDASAGGAITVVNVDVNGSSVYASYVTSASVLVTCQTFIGNPIVTSATVVS